MPPIATDVAWSVCVSVCLSVGRTSEPYKNGRPDQDAVWIVDLGGTRNHALGGSGVVSGTTVRALVLGRFSQK